MAHAIDVVDNIIFGTATIALMMIAMLFMIQPLRLFFSKSTVSNAVYFIKICTFTGKRATNFRVAFKLFGRWGDGDKGSSAVIE